MQKPALTHKAILSFFHPDFTVGPGVSPDHALALAAARGLYHRLGIPRLAEISMKAGHPFPEGTIEDILLA